MTEPIKVPSNFTEVLMALILPYHTPSPIDDLLELESRQDGPEDLIIVDSDQLTYIPSEEGVSHA